MRPARDEPVTRWARRLGLVDVAVACSGTVHTIRWRRGSIVAVDHDVPAELALLALGGPEPPCLSVLGTWRHTDLDTITTPEAIRSRMRSHGQVPEWVVSLPAGLDEVRRLTLVVNAERSWSGRPSTASGYLVRETQCSAVPQLRAWVVASGEGGLQPVTVTAGVAWPSADPQVNVRREGGTLVVGVEVSASWWRVVGSGRSALVDRGRGFVLDRRPATDLVVHWQGGRPVIAERERSS